jgi:NAD(P)-dependent dehydrogenase (short-subunit alcohol dehydrogenase family)
MRTFDLTGQKVAITGARGGIGSAAARLAAAQGADLVLADLVAPGETAAAVQALGRSASAAALDVSDRVAVEAWASEVGPVDALIDCAAICPFDDWEGQGWDDTFERVLDVNLHGPVNLCRAFMRPMMERGGGRVALVGSIAGRIGGVRSGPHYVMSKGGIHSFVRWAAKVGASHNVLVNAVAPGVVATDMTAEQSFDESEFPLRRQAEAEEIAGPLVFLVSPAASYITGAVLDVNGALHFS